MDIWWATEQRKCLGFFCSDFKFQSINNLFGFQGPLQLWNLKSGKKIYKFKGWKSPVTCLEPCPQVLDAVAIGLESGDIIGKWNSWLKFSPLDGDEIQSLRLNTILTRFPLKLD